MEKNQLQFLSDKQSRNKLLFVLKWFLISSIVGILVGSASAFFLVSLDWATNWREDNTWIIWLLPLGGLLIGLIYHYFGKEVVKGNNQIIEEYYHPMQVIPLKMAPLVLFGTIATHFFGGSAGREGTAVQMGAAISDQFALWFKMSKSERRMLLILGISAGFASVFGTPLAGAIFAIEVLIIGQMRYPIILPSLITAYIAHFTCLWWNVGHTHYEIPFVPGINFELILWSILAGTAFGLAAFTFSKSVKLFTRLFVKLIKYPPLRPFVAGTFIAVFVFAIGTTKYIGLGIPTIVEAFQNPLPPADFLIKIAITAFTLAAGFKGGEVTPLFFIGATLGNALSLFIPLPMALLAGMGFVAVFSGATNTPIACTVMGFELFGAEGLIFIGIACFTAYLFSWFSGIYSEQSIHQYKYSFFRQWRKKHPIEDL